MKFGEVTTVEKLSVGDRFYFVKDKEKVVYEVFEQKKGFTKWATLSTIIFQPEYARAVKMHVKEGRKVAFLRNVQQQ